MNARLFSALQILSLEGPKPALWRHNSCTVLWVMGLVLMIVQISGSLWDITPAGRAKLAELEQKG